jgi:hypothetical protein
MPRETGHSGRVETMRKALIFGMFQSVSAHFTIPDNITADSHWRQSPIPKLRYPYLYGLDRFCPTHPATVGETIKD